MQSSDIATAGKLAKHLSQWKKFLSDNEILQTVSGHTIEFEFSTCPCQEVPDREFHFN